MVRLEGFKVYLICDGQLTDRFTGRVRTYEHSVEKTLDSTKKICRMADLSASVGVGTLKPLANGLLSIFS